MNFRLITPVWGDLFVDMFLNACLPSIQGQVGGMEWHIWTTEGDRKRMERYMPSETVWHMCSGETGAIHDGFPEYKRIQEEAVKGAYDDKACALFVSPDCVFSSVTITNAVRAVEKGFNAVLCPKIRVLQDRWRTLPLPPHSGADLAAIAFESPHPLTQAFFADAERFTTWPSNIIRRGNDEWVYNCLHMELLAIKPARMQPFHNIDFDVARALCDRSGVYVATDSDNMCRIDLTNSDQFVTVECLIGDKPMDVDTVLRWEVMHDSAGFNLWLKKHDYRLHV